MSTEKTDTASAVRDLAEKGVEQARSALDTLLEAARKTAESIQTTTNTADIPAGQAVQRGFGYAKENISAIFDYAQRLARAPDIKEAARLHTDFVQNQSAVMKKQVEELQSLTPKGGDTKG